MTSERDKDLDWSWAWWQPVIGIVLIILLGRLLRMWFPGISFATRR